MVGQNVRVRALLIGIAVIVVALAGGAVGVDFGTAIYAEYRLSRTLRAEANWAFDPWVGILGFPFIPQAMRHRYGEVEIRASGVDRPIIGKASLEATLYSVDLTQSVLAVRPGRPAAGGQGRKPDHHRLDPSRPIHGHQRPAGRGPAEGDQRRDRRHHRVRHLEQHRPGVHRNPEGRGLQRAGQRLGGPVDDRPGRHARWCSRRPGSSPAPAPRTAPCPTTS